MDAGKRRALERKRKTQRIKELSRLPVTPYEGSRYRAERWVPHVYATERAVYETILLTADKLSNQQVRAAFEQLVRHLRSNLPGPLPDGETETVYASGSEVEFLIWNIRNHWRQLVEEQGNVDKEDLIGILRTLLFSIQAHALDRGPRQGYVSFLREFMERIRQAGL